MFESHESDKLGGISSIQLRGKGALTEEDDVNLPPHARSVSRLLEADVALPVVKDFIETVKDHAPLVPGVVIKSVYPRPASYQNRP